VNNGRTPNDIDVLVRGRLPEELRRVIEFRLSRMLPPDLSSRVHLLNDDLGGPFTDHVELADLVIEVRPTLDVKRMRLVEKQDDPLLDLPKERGPRPAVLQYHFRGKSVHADLRLRVNDHLVGWTLSLQRPGAIADPVDTVEEARRIARSFSVEGDRYTKPLVAPAKVFATPKARQPIAWLDVDGEVFGEGEVGATANEKGVIVAVERPKVEWGLQKPFAHEYFLSGGQELNGILYFRLLTGQPGEPAPEVEAGRRSPEGEPFWTAFLSRELLPSVLKPRAVETHSMPPDGYSAIPVSLERDAPHEFRYWEAKGDEAREMRDALVEAKHFTAENVRLVDGEFRRVVQKLFLAPSPVEAVEKARQIPFQQWGGSAKYARRLADRLPEHKRYVEPFCGAAALFYAKPPSEEEVLADADPDVVFAHRHLQKLDKRAFAMLKRLPWTVSRAGFEKARACEPRSDAERFWKLAYGRLCTWGAKPNMSGFATIHDGQTYDLDDLWRFHDRLEGARLVTQDWLKTLAECDGAGTLFFIDPPYAEEWAVGDGIPPEEVADAVAKLKGDYVIAYTDSARARRALAKVGRTFKMKIPEGRSAGQWQKRNRLFVASFKLRKLDDVDWLDDEDDDGDVCGAVATSSQPAALAPADPGRAPEDVAKQPADVLGVAQPQASRGLIVEALAKHIPVIKTGEERYVLGIVLEPETVDAQKDIYSAAEIREAAHRFMEEYRNVGLMHREIVNGRVKILESYLAPADLDLAGTRVKKGTWLLAVRVLDDDLWRQVKDGEIGGFSIGGSARREANPAVGASQ
jgi:DNA adenine methylase